jgi:hypothetical protein
MKVIFIVKGKLEFVDEKPFEKSKIEGVTLIRKRGVKAIARPYDDYFSCFQDILKDE